jgi:hypothetical protein
LILLVFRLIFAATDSGLLVQTSPIVLRFSLDSGGMAVNANWQMKNYFSCNRRRRVVKSTCSHFATVACSRVSSRGARLREKQSESCVVLFLFWGRLFMSSRQIRIALTSEEADFIYELAEAEGITFSEQVRRIMKAGLDVLRIEAVDQLAEIAKESGVGFSDTSLGSTELRATLLRDTPKADRILKLLEVEG